METDVKSRITGMVQEILDQTFQGEKRRIKLHHDRITFSCPYCGDSSDPHKKRGNLYWNGLRYHCYNGGCENSYASLSKFLRDHGKGVNGDQAILNAMVEANEHRQKGRQSVKTEHAVLRQLGELAIPISSVCQRMRLVPVEQSEFAVEYLRSRLIYDHREIFRFSPSEKTLYIFNTDASGDKAIGLQISRFSGPNKYISFNLEKMRGLVGLGIPDMDDDRRANLNRLSIFFGILKCDFSQKVTIFEGVIDHLFVKNSIAITGLKKNIEELDGINFRYMFDNDLDGFKKSMGLLKRKKTVFLWGKAIKELGLDTNIKDMNDLALDAKKKNKAVELDRFFTKNPSDLLYL